MPHTIAELNALDRDAFVAAVGHVFEQSPWIAAAAWERRPFAERAALLRAMLDVVSRAGPERQLALIRAHPDLAGRLALAGALTPDSAREQASAGLSSLTPAELERFTGLNAAYTARFGFPFVICVRQQTKTSILAAFERRLANDREAEVAAALGEIGAIARLRLADAVAP
jgi:2-oxo-4-hydroxy-4-carboxy-5-ureidoimidazoline decarboxylase